MMEIFKKVEINIPFLDAIKQIPKYAKFLKELCTCKRNLPDDKQVKKIGRNGSGLIQSTNVSAITQPTMPQKCKDPGTFIIPCTICESTFVDVMLDLGAPLNVMPTSVYRSFQLGDLRPTKVFILLVNRSTAQPLGVMEDVLVKVNDLVFPVDFYILGMEDESSSHDSYNIVSKYF